MTTAQGKINDITQRITSITDKVICQSLGEIVDSYEFKQNITNIVATPFINDITKKASDKYIQCMDPNNYAKKIENIILDVAESKEPLKFKKRQE